MPGGRGAAIQTAPTLEECVRAVTAPVHSFKLWHRDPSETPGGLSEHRRCLSHVRQTLGRECLLYRGRLLSMPAGQWLMCDAGTSPTEKCVLPTAVYARSRDRSR